MKKKVPKLPPYDVRKYYKEHVESQNREYQVLWLRFEYTRRNKAYQDHFEELRKRSDLFVDDASGILLYQDSFLFDDLDLQRTWHLPYYADYHYPFPHITRDNPQSELSTLGGLFLEIRRIQDIILSLSWENTVDPKRPTFHLIFEIEEEGRRNRVTVGSVFDLREPQIQPWLRQRPKKLHPIAYLDEHGKEKNLQRYKKSEYEWIYQVENVLKFEKKNEHYFEFEPRQILQVLTPEHFSASPSGEYVGHPLDIFHLQRDLTQDPPFTWDEASWMVLAINRNVSRKEILQRLEQAGLFQWESRGKSLDFSAHLKRLRAYDLACYPFSNAQIAQQIHAEFNMGKRYIPSDQEINRMIRECEVNINQGLKIS